jgi:uncharacterized protein
VGPASRPFHLLAKPIGPICNLDCAYCFYLRKETLYPGRTGKAAWTMSDAVLDAFVRDYIVAQPGAAVSFAWQGGEPTLLGLDFFRKVVALQQRHANGKRVENALQTNGVLLDDEWGAFLAEHDFLVGISIDGPRDVHDRYRADKGGQPTFERVVRGVGVLREHRVTFSTLTVVHAHNARRPLEVYGFLKDLGSRFLQFIPIVERSGTPGEGPGPALACPNDRDAPVTPWSVRPEDYGAFLTAIFDQWVRTDVGRVAVQLFEVALESWLGMPQSVCLFRETCGDAMAIEHNGDIYSCDHYVFPANRLGNVLEDPLASLVSAPAQRRFGQAKRETLPGYCLSCAVRFACHGECPKNRFTKTPDGEPGLNYLCAAYKRFFTHVDPAMRFLARQVRAGLPASDVMAWARARDLTAGGDAGAGGSDK